MEFFQTITQRESIRSYNPQKQVPQDILRQILEAGRLAPSAANLQPWKFVLVSSPEQLEKIRVIYPRPWFVEAPHILIVVGDKSKSWVRPADSYNSIETDLTIAMDHMILAAESLGVGTCWVGNFDYQTLRQLLQLEESEVVFALTPLGYPKDGFSKKGIKTRKSFDEIVKFL